MLLSPLARSKASAVLNLHRAARYWSPQWSHAAAAACQASGWGLPLGSRASARAIAANAAGSARSSPPDGLAMASMSDSRVVSASTVPGPGAGQPLRPRSRRCTPWVRRSCRRSGPRSPGQLRCGLEPRRGGLRREPAARPGSGCWRRTGHRPWRQLVPSRAPACVPLRQVHRAGGIRRSGGRRN